MSRGGGAGYGAIREYHDDPERGEYRDSPRVSAARNVEIIEQIRSNIFKINNGANTIDRAMKNIGTEKDTPMLRDKIHETSTNTNRVVQDTTRLLKVAASYRGADKTQRMQLERLKSDFQESVQRFQTLQKKAADKAKSSLKLGQPAAANPMSQTAGWTEDAYTDRAGLLEQEERRQTLMAQQQVIEDDLGLIREREERIRQLEADILDVNEIFRDLGTMIHEQGEVLDTIESNVERAYTNVGSGTEQLVKAAEYQRKSRKKMCCLLVIVLIVVAIIVIVVVTQVHKS